jgi:hypothetical protein
VLLQLKEQRGSGDGRPQHSRQRGASQQLAADKRRYLPASCCTAAAALCIANARQQPLRELAQKLAALQRQVQLNLIDSPATVTKARQLPVVHDLRLQMNE